MPFNYNQNFNAIQADPRIIEGASNTPFSIAGKAMTQLDNAIEDRAFEKGIGAAKTLNDLSLLNPTTDKQRAIMASKQGVFNTLAQEDMRNKTFDLQAATAQMQAERDIANELYRNKALGLQQQQINMPSFQKGDVVANPDGTFSRAVFDTKTAKTSYVPSSEAEYFRGLGKGGKASYGTFMVNDKPTYMSKDDALKFNAIPIGDYKTFKETVTDNTNVIGPDNRVLSKEESAIVNKNIAPYMSRPNRDALLQQSVDKVNEGFWTFDGKPDKKQFDMLSTSLGEMVMNPKWKYNVSNAGQGMELINVINDYRKEQGQSAILRAGPVERAFNWIPFTGEGYNTEATPEEKVQMYIDNIGADNQQTRPTFNITN